MRPHLVWRPTAVVVGVVVAAVLLGSSVAEGSSFCTVFPDARFVAQGDGVDLNVASEFNDCSVWGCAYITGDESATLSGFTTGRGCGERCVKASVPECQENEYTAHCDPPHNARCVACPQVGAEAAEGGYSFAPPGVNSKAHDRLHQRGTFEFAKLYPAALPVRSAVDQRNSTIGLVPWRDIMFASSVAEWSERLQWYGLGKIDLELSTFSAHQSDVYMKLSAPRAKVRVCNVEFSNGDPWDNSGTAAAPQIQQNSNTRGLIYEFWYRQVMEYTQGIEAAVHLTDGSATHTALQTNTHAALASTSEWTLVQGVFDYVSAHSHVPAFGCLQLDFRMKELKEVLVDDLRLLRSLLSNPFFRVWGGTKANRYGENGGWTVFMGAQGHPVVHHPEEGTNTYSYVTIPANMFISQVVELPTQEGQNGLYLAATLSIHARGGGAWLVVESKLGEEAGAAGAEEWGYHAPELVVKRQLPDTGTDAWTLVSVPLTLHINTMDESVSASTGKKQPRYHFTVYAHQGPVDVKSALLYVDDRRCPIHGCDNPRTEVLVNGQCERCSTTGQKCDASEYQSGCRLVDFVVDATCEPCSEPLDPTGDPYTGGQWLPSGDLECSYQCADGAWFQRAAAATAAAAAAAAGTCAPCTSPTSLRCPVGFYARACGVDFDAGCVPCNDLDVSDYTVVYTAGARYDLGMYSEDKDRQCTHACTPGSFQYGVVAGTSTPTCFPCTTSVCGAPDNGISTLRLIDGLQYTSKCMRAKDSRCQLCSSDDTNVVFTGSADTVGAWCDYECRAGTTMCTGCTWNPKQAHTVRTHEHYRPEDSSEVPLDPTLKLVRLAGRASITTAQFGAQVVVSMHVASSTATWPSAPITVLQVFPVVPPAALASVSVRTHDYYIHGAPEQAFDVVVDVDSIIWNDGLFQLWLSQQGNNGPVHLVYRVELLPGSSAATTPGTPPDPPPRFNVTALDVETISTPGLGCCGVVGSAPQDSVNPRELMRCRACGAALLPTHAHWDQPNDCSWVCDQHYEVMPGGDARKCEECFKPNCLSGEHWTACDTCAPCRPSPDNSVVAGPGLTRYDNSSCPFACNAGFFRTPDDRCLACTPSSTLNCTTKRGGPYFEQGCSRTQDASCLNCQVCPLGSNASTPCSTHSNTVCSPCDVSRLGMPLLAARGGGAEWTLGETTADFCRWRCQTGLTHNTQLQTCFRCTEACASGYYPVPCVPQNNFAQCLPCNLPAHAVVLTSGTLLLPDSCSWTCASGDTYNRTSKECAPVPVFVAPTIMTEPAAVACPKPSICGFGFHLDDDAPDGTPCAERCVPCSTPPPNLDTTSTYEDPTVYMRRGSCAWICRTPLMKDGDKCVAVP